MTFRDLEIFVTIVKTGSMRAAAAELYITQPSISATISEIEKTYHVKLFERSGRILVLTTTGKHFYNYASEILNLNKDMKSYLLYESEHPGIRIGATVTVGGCIIAPLVTRLKADNPSIAYEITVDNTTNLEKLLLRGDLDIGIVEGNIVSNSLYVTPMMEDELVCICSVKHRFVSKQSVKLKDITDEPLIVREQGSGTRAMLSDALARHQFPFNPIWSSSCFDSIKQAVLMNLGITVMSPKLVQQEILSGFLHSCRITDANFRRTFDLVYKKNKFLSPTMQRFIQLCKENTNSNYPDHKTAPFHITENIFS